MEQMFLKCLNLGIRASWMILAVLLIRLLFREGTAKYRVWLWIAVFVRLVFPFSLKGIFSFLPGGDTVPEGIMMAEKPAITSGFKAVDQAVNPVLQKNFSPAPYNSANPMQVLVYACAMVWIAGMIIMLGYMIVSSFLLNRRIRESGTVHDGILESGSVDSPFVYGIFFPLICLPAHLEEEKKHYIVLHEKMHLARKDNILKPAAFIILSVYWYHPLVWLAYVLLCRDIEAACDEAVISQMSKEEQNSYAETLLGCAVSKRRLASPAAFGETNVKKRIRGILNYKKPSVWIAALLIVLGIAVCAGFFSEPAKGEAQPQPGPSETDEPVPSETDEPLPAETVLTLDTEEAEYSCTDSGICAMFDELFDQLMTVQPDQRDIRESEEIDNICDGTIRMKGKSLGYQYGSLLGLSQDSEFSEGYHISLVNEGRKRCLLLRGGSDIASRLAGLAETIAVNGTKAKHVNIAEDDEWVKSWLNQLGKPEDYIFPINSLDGFLNAETWNQFLERCESGTAASVTIADYTIEGDLIYTYLYYDQEGYYFARDNSRDSFGGPENSFESYYFKYLFHGDQEIEEEGRRFRQQIAVVSDTELQSYKEALQYLENGNNAVIVFGRTELIQ